MPARSISAPALVVALLCAVRPAAAQPEPGDPGRRARVLVEHIDRYGVSFTGGDTLGAVLSIVDGAVALPLGLALVGQPEVRGSSILLISGGAIGVAGGVTALAVDREYRESIATAAAGPVVGTMFGAVALIPDLRTRPEFAVPLWSMAGAFTVHGALVGIDAALTRPVSVRTLRDHRDRLEQGPADEATVADAERAYARTDRPIPRWAMGIPHAAAGAVCLIYSTTLSAGERNLAQLVGGLEAVLGSLTLLSPLWRHGYSDYQREVAGYRVAPLVGPAVVGIGVEGDW